MSLICTNSDSARELYEGLQFPSKEDVRRKLQVMFTECWQLHKRHAKLVQFVLDSNMLKHFELEYDHSRKETEFNFCFDDLLKIKKTGVSYTEVMSMETPELAYYETATGKAQKAFAIYYMANNVASRIARHKKMPLNKLERAFIRKLVKLNLIHQINIVVASNKSETIHAIRFCISPVTFRVQYNYHKPR